jgi:hypothetical protein
MKRVLIYLAVLTIAVGPLLATAGCKNRKRREAVIIEETERELSREERPVIEGDEESTVTKTEVFEDERVIKKEVRPEMK